MAAVRGRRGARWAAFVLLGGLAAWFVVTSFGELPRSFSALGAAEPEWLAGAAGAEVVSYLLLGFLLKRLSGPGRRISTGLGVSTGLVAFGLGNVLPGSPAPGFALAGMELRRRGLPIRKVTLMMSLAAWFLARAFLAIAAAVAVTIAAGGRLPDGRDAIVMAAASLVLALVLASAWLQVHPWPLERLALLTARWRWRGEPNAAERARAMGQRWHSDVRQGTGSASNRELMTVVSIGSWIADAACLRLALAAVGVDLDFDVLLLAYLAAIVVSCLPFVPGGIGAVEAVVPALLHHYGVPLEAAIAGVLAWRGLALAAPAAAGAAVLGALRLGSWWMTRHETAVTAD